VLLGKEDGNIDVWNIENGKSTFTKTLQGHNTGPVSCLASNPMYAQFASASHETALWIW
jgi:WD40 repeat protein